MQNTQVYTGSKRRHDGVALNQNYGDTSVNQAVYENLQALIRTKKIFVGGLPQNTKEEDLVKFFSQFGPVDHADLIREKENGRFRGFGFVYFMNEATAESVIHHKYFCINDKKVEVKKALPKEVLENQNAALQAAVSMVSGPNPNSYLTPAANNHPVAPVAAGPSNPTLNPLAIPPSYLQGTGLNNSANPALPVRQQPAPQVPQQPRLPLPTNMPYALTQDQIAQILLSTLQTAQPSPYPSAQPIVYNPNTLMADFSQLPYAGINPAQLIQGLNGNTQAGYYNQVPMAPPQQLDPFSQYCAAQLGQLNPTAAALLQQIQAGQAMRIPIPTAPTPIPTNTITYGQALPTQDRLTIPLPSAQPAIVQHGPKLNNHGSATGQPASSSNPKPSNSTEKQPPVPQIKTELADGTSGSLPNKMPR
ncbi:unnamed protein product [Rodentolepis nana]|uniref:RRM domain-containing protein n=1 Tax=Rodentolepis nana TaxID=102285 RepID=A0A0R3T978_RODNA|nr:unnamed protein product [Rodentolepis nana]